MRRNQTSLTAMGITVMRAVESEKPAGERICSDPYARRFLPGWFYSLIRFFISTGYAEWRGPGVIGFLAVRERCIDDFLAERLEQGFNQLVVLGAGYDSRAYRFDGLRSLRVFEVDHPATQADKLEKVHRIFGKLPEHVTYVAIDFNEQTLAAGLLPHGYNPLAKTVFIWQGVTYYLEPVVVDSTLAFVSEHSGPGSSIVFDYIDDTLLAKPADHTEIKSMHRYRGLSREEITFGIPIAGIEDYLVARGFTQVRNLRSEELKTRYFHGKNQSRDIMAGYAIVSAEVAN